MWLCSEDVKDSQRCPLVKAAALNASDNTEYPDKCNRGALRGKKTEQRIHLILCNEADILQPIMTFPVSKCKASTKKTFNKSVSKVYKVRK